MWIEIFYNELNGQTRIIVDSTPGGTLMAKTSNAAYSLLDNIAMNSYQWSIEISSMKRAMDLHEADPITALAALISSLIN